MSLIILGIVILLIAIVLFALGARGVAGLTMQVGKWVLIVGVVLAILFFLFGSGVFHTRYYP